MVKVQTIAEMLMKGLSTERISFDIHADTGDAKYYERKPLTSGKETVQGVLRSVSGDIVPLPELDNYSTHLALEVMVKDNIVSEVEELLTNYIQANAGKSAGEAGAIDGYASIISFDVPLVGATEIRPIVGKSVPMQVTVFLQLIRNGVLSNSCIISIDGEKLLALSFSLPRTRIEQTDNVENREEMQSVITQQGLEFVADIPYLNTPVTKKLMQDILTGGLSRVYRLSYSDPVLGAQEWTVVLKSAAPSYEAAKVPVLSLRFLMARSDLYEV